MDVPFVVCRTRRPSASKRRRAAVLPAAHGSAHVSVSCLLRPAIRACSAKLAHEEAQMLRGRIMACAQTIASLRPAGLRSTRETFRAARESAAGSTAALAAEEGSHTKKHICFENRSQRVLRQLPRCALRDSEAHGKRFAPLVKVPQAARQPLPRRKVVSHGSPCHWVLRHEKSVPPAERVSSSRERFPPKRSRALPTVASTVSAARVRSRVMSPGAWTPPA